MHVIYGILETHQCVLEGTGMTRGLDLALQGFLQKAGDLPGGSLLYNQHIL